MTDLYAQNERERAEHERRLVAHQGQPPTSFEDGVTLIKEALRRPHFLDHMLAGGGRDAAFPELRRSAPVPRREVDLRRPEGQAAAFDQIRAALARPIAGDAALVAWLGRGSEPVGKAEPAPQPAAAAADPAGDRLAKLPISLPIGSDSGVLAKRAPSAPKVPLPPGWEWFNDPPGSAIWSRRKAA